MSKPLSSLAVKRIQKELERFEDAGCGLSVEPISPSVWMVTLLGVVGTLYEGETFTLRVTFDDAYPMECAEVCDHRSTSLFLYNTLIVLNVQIVFVGTPPVHPHIYSNGHICLNILYEDWSPALTIKNVCMSILSMLSSNTVRSPPEDNSSYTRVPRPSPKLTRFAYHDDGV